MGETTSLINTGRGRGLHPATRFALRAALRLALAGACLHGGAAHAIGLLQAYEAALKNDPTYRAAYYDNESGKEFAVIGRANVLPSVSANYSYNKNRADIEAETNTGDPTHTHPRYVSRSGALQLRQPLFNLEAAARYKQGIAQSNVSAAQFKLRGQDLVMRLVGAYLDALFAGEELALAQAHRDAFIEQRKVNDKLFERGEGTRTDMLETQARLDVAEAAVLEAQDEEVTARNTLSGIVGIDIRSVDRLGPGFKVRPQAQGGFEAWKARALASNPEIQAQLYAVEAAGEEMARSRGAHAPKLDLVAAYTTNESDTINTLHQHAAIKSIGLQLNIPLYSGGQASAVSRQAVAAHERAKADLQARIEKILIEVRKEHNASISSDAKIAALEKAVASGELLVKATEQSIKGGVRINLDLLNARQQMFSTRRDLSHARYNYFLSSLRLRAAAGALGREDVRELAAHFQ
ncbi:MAG: TolC family outer membrane protein [Pseudomonadota bacterium]